MRNFYWVTTQTCVFLQKCEYRKVTHVLIFIAVSTMSTEIEKKQGVELTEQKQATHKIRITLTSRNVKALEKGLVSLNIRNLFVFFSLCRFNQRSKKEGNCCKGTC